MDSVQKPPKTYFLYLVGVILLSTYAIVYAADLDNCADELDRLRRASRDAADTAEEARSKYDDLENCVNFPDTFDLMQDNCQSLRWDYQSAVNDLESELDTVNSRIRSVQYSCGYEFSLSTVIPGSPNSGTEMCNLFKNYMSTLPLDTLLNACKGNMSEADCKKCLGIK